MKTIGVIGTAKNTGKTTTLSFLLKKFVEKKFNVCITGIGYDGEEIDNITNLPKPRIFLEEDTIVATSEKCLTNSQAKFELLFETDFSTALGKISVVKITRAGLMVVAGPNTRKGLTELLRLIKDKTSVNLILVDGSLNRISPMEILDKIVFTTGASRNTNIDQIVEEMKVIEKVFSYEKTILNHQLNSNIILFYSDNSVQIEIKSLIDENDLIILEKFLYKKIERIFIPSLFTIKTLLNGLYSIQNKFNYLPELIFKSPTQLLLTGDFVELSTLIDSIKKRNISISYVQKPDLAAITVNPFYPKLVNYNFIADFVDKFELLNKMKNSLYTPVFNIFEKDADEIFNFL